MNRLRFQHSFMLAAVMALAGCNEKTTTVAQPAAQPATAPAGQPAAQAPVAAAPVATAPVVDALAPRYEATLAEGIDFKKVGYPSFLTEVAGVSGQEAWGRWTDAGLAPTARFRFKQPLPKQLTLELIATPFGNNLDQPITVRIGKSEQTFVAKASSEPAQPYILKFDGLDGADTIEIVPPKPTMPNELDSKNMDTRKLGVGLVSLRIK